MELEMAAISNTLVNPVFLKALASTSKVEQSEFELIDVVPIRGTHIVLVRFAGADRDVERVASNTFGVLEQFCFTNRSEINTENIEATLSRRRVLWERLWHQWEYRRP
jgi:hypothetical protein